MEFHVHGYHLQSVCNTLGINCPASNPRAELYQLLPYESGTLWLTHNVRNPPIVLMIPCSFHAHVEDVSCSRSASSLTHRTSRAAPSSETGCSPPSSSSESHPHSLLPPAASPRLPQVRVVVRTCMAGSGVMRTRRGGGPGWPSEDRGDMEVGMVAESIWVLERFVGIGGEGARGGGYLV
ncbi:hypothetical protein BD309DRAFT_967659 [Dichomitus squalens]|nr:hypothetical protein BD309DRAFT_967659 [Dichomitus squalens]